MVFGGIAYARKGIAVVATVRVAVSQIDPHLAEVEHNLGLIETSVARAAREGAELVVLPECAVTGYVFESYEEASAVAEPIPGPVSERIATLTRNHDIYAVVGMLESAGDRVYNSALLSGPRGIEAVYRKSHTLCLGVDRFVAPGDLPYRVVDLPFARIGVLICYDLRFPEAARSLALNGAQIVALPTNWPITSAIQCDVFTRARAAENRVFLLAADRVGRERGAQFLGRSQVVAPDGSVLAEASSVDSELLIADIEIAEADRKHVVVRPGEHEMDCMADRRPDLYGALTGQGAPALRS